MGLYIRDDKVKAMAKHLAEKRRTTVTEVVRRALERELEEIERDLQERDQRLRASFARLDAMPRLSDFGDDDMYDETGVPK